MYDFGEPTLPFGRFKGVLPPYKKLEDWHCIREDFDDLIHNGEFNGLPQYPNELKIVPEEYIEELSTYGKITNFDIKKEFCYLWVLNTSKVFEIIWEGTTNEKDTAGNLIKHSNITAGGLAYNGGEMYFGTSKIIYLNNESDRYGKYPGHWEQVVKYFSQIYNSYEIKSVPG